MISKAASQDIGVSCPLTRKRGVLSRSDVGPSGLYAFRARVPSPDAVVAAAIDHGGGRVGLHHNVMRLAVNHGDVMLVRTDPAL